MGKKIKNIAAIKRSSYIYELIIPGDRHYIGQRHCPKNKLPEEDNYLGSGNIITAYKRKHGTDKIKKKILRSGLFTQKELDKLEKKYIKQCRKRYAEKCINLSDGGAPSSNYAYDRSEHNKKISESITNWHKSLSYYKKRKINKKVSEANKGNIPANKGKHYKLTTKTKEKMSKSRKGDRLYNNGSKEIRIAKDKKPPKGFKKGGLSRGCYKGTDRCKKISDSNKGRKWFHNPKTGETKFCFKCPVGFIKGANRKGTFCNGKFIKNKNYIKIVKSNKK